MFFLPPCLISWFLHCWIIVRKCLLKRNPKNSKHFSQRQFLGASMMYFLLTPWRHWSCVFAWVWGWAPNSCFFFCLLGTWAPSCWIFPLFCPFDFSYFLCPLPHFQFHINLIFGSFSSSTIHHFHQSTLPIKQH